MHVVQRVHYRQSISQATFTRHTQTLTTLGISILLVRHYEAQETQMLLIHDKNAAANCQVQQKFYHKNSMKLSRTVFTDVINFVIL